MEIDVTLNIVPYQGTKKNIDLGETFDVVKFEEKCMTVIQNRYRHIHFCFKENDFGVDKNTEAAYRIIKLVVEVDDNTNLSRTIDEYGFHIVENKLNDILCLSLGYKNDNLISPPMRFVYKEFSIH